mgnify:CR=1 FL=1
MSSKYDMDKIRKYWTEQAIEHGDSSSASWSDHRAIDMEIHEIISYIDDGDKVIDIGCANGYSTIQFACQKRIEITGIDLIPEMIEIANMRKNQFAEKILDKAEFNVGDLLALDHDRQYDKVIVTRAIINLNNWENQRKALKNCMALVKPDGLFLLSAATIQGWQNLNKMRREWGLKEIPMPTFNCYLDEEKVVEAVSPSLKLMELKNFSSTYYIGTRVLKPLLNAALGNRINEADPDMEWNRWFSQLPAWGDYGTQKFFVFKKVR